MDEIFDRIYKATMKSKDKVDVTFAAELGQKLKTYKKKMESFEDKFSLWTSNVEYLIKSRKELKERKSNYGKLNSQMDKFEEKLIKKLDRNFTDFEIKRKDN